MLAPRARITWHMHVCVCITWHMHAMHRSVGPTAQRGTAERSGALQGLAQCAHFASFVSLLMVHETEPITGVDDLSDLASPGPSMTRNKPPR